MRFDELSRDILADVRRCVEQIDGATVDAIAAGIAERGRVFLIGSGRSGKVLEAMAIRLGHLGIAAHVAGSPECPPVREDDLVLVGSGSGRTARSLGLAEGARAAGATLAVITADPDSPIAGLAETVVDIPAPVTLGDGSTGLAADGSTGLAADGSTGLAAGGSTGLAAGGSTGLAADGTPHTLRSLFEECLLIVCDGMCRLVQDRLGLSTDDMQARHAPDQ